MSAEGAGTCILNTKLYAPRLPEVIPREKLFGKLSDAGIARLTIIVAGAGYGKSTLVNSFLAQRDDSTVWYQLEETDRDLYEFISYLIAGIRMKKSDFGEDTLSRLHAVEDMTNEGETVIFNLISEMDALIKDDLVIVLDDFQNVNESSPVTNALDLLIHHMPQNIHMIILTRARPRLDLPTLAGRRDMVEIGEEDLRFTPSETEELFAGIFGMSVNPDHTAKLCEYTEGWVTGLVLFCLAVKERGEAYVKEAIKSLDAPPSMIAEYLSGVIYEGQSEAIREFLMQTSLLLRMNPVFCDRLLGISDSGTILDYLVNSRIFTINQDNTGGWFRYHQIFRSFLRLRLYGSNSREYINSLHLKAASLWEERGEMEQALHHYMAAADYERAAEMLNRAAPEFMNSSRISFLRENIQELPEDVVWKYPWLTYQFAEICHLQGDFERALKASKRAAELFEDSGEIEALLNSMIRTGMAMFEMGRAEEYEKTISELFNQVEVGSTLWYSLSAVLGKYSIVEGKYDLAERFTANALENIYKIEDMTLKSNLLFSSGMVILHTGDFRESCHMIHEAMELAESVGNLTFAMNMICVLAPSTITMGNFEEALELADKGLAMSETGNYDTPFTYLCLVSKSSALSLLGEKEAARSEMEQALQVSKTCGQGAEVMYANYFMAGLHMYFGAREQALYHFNIAKHIARDIPFIIVEHMSRLGEIQLSYKDIGIEAAVAETRSIASFVKDSFNDMFSIHPYIILAYLEQVAGYEAEARKALEKGVDMTARSRAYGLWKWAITDNEEIALVLLPLLVEMFSRGVNLEVLGEILEYIGQDAFPFVKELSRSGDGPVKEKARELSERMTADAIEPLHIKTLGAFEVSRGGKKILPRDWKSRKALAIMKYLSAQEDDHHVSRDVMMELLWPGSTEESASKNLGVALSHLRKILEPDAVRGESSYLVADGNLLRLELGKGGTVDFKLFRKAVKEAVKAETCGDTDMYLEKLHQAEKYYGGEFMAEDLYDDWCRVQRDQLKNEFINFLLRISKEYERRESFHEAFFYMDKAVKSDPDREDLYRIQMEICASLGNRPGIERAFKNCCEHLKKTYNVSPSPETVEVYQRLRED